MTSPPRPKTPGIPTEEESEFDAFDDETASHSTFTAGGTPVRSKMRRGTRFDAALEEPVVRKKKDDDDDLGSLEYDEPEPEFNEDDFFMKSVQERYIESLRIVFADERVHFKEIQEEEAASKAAS